MLHPLNREAGSVLMPRDPREVAVAQRAARVTWRAFPYYAFRYGERGARFAASDSAFLLTLADVPVDAAERQARWLAKVLTARGMPSWMLERHLGVIARVAARELGTPARFAPIRAAAAALAHARRAHLPDRAFDEFGAFFAQRAGFAGRRFAEGTGRMIASAAADTLAYGIAPALENLLGWLADAERFDATWCVAARATGAAALRALA